MRHRHKLHIGHYNPRSTVKVFDQLAATKFVTLRPRLADVVECRFFGGYSEADTARALGLSLRTVQRDWLKARAWLFRELHGGG